MGFKTDTSFLRFLSMGAAGVRQTIHYLKSEGFEPIELERYSGSNKIWATKVKRLRLPDVLCVRTGLRVEVRAKSDLKIRMSDAPLNPDRHWDSGLRDNDLVALIACREDNGKEIPAQSGVLFTVGDLRAKVETSRLGPPKSASEGAERDRVWPCVVPSQDGVVLHVTHNQILAELHGEGGRRRRQTYKLDREHRLHSYVWPGEHFVGEASILAGTPQRLADLAGHRNAHYDPLSHLAAENAVDRYAAVKALPYRQELKARAVPAIERRLDAETDERVLLEAAGAGAALDSAKAVDWIHRVIWDNERHDLRMEAVLILTELRNPTSAEVLRSVVADEQFVGDELRQAAVWGLGKAGLKDYGALLTFIADDEDDVALHAIAAFGSDVPQRVIDKLVSALRQPDRRLAAAASESLVIIGNDKVARTLIANAEAYTGNNDWILATLGRLPITNDLEKALAGTPLLEKLRPIILLSEGKNWLAKEAVSFDLQFLLKQDIG